jgi:DNA-binding transcriptional LysR family regulator
VTGPLPFRVGFVPGVTLTKWSGVWSERHPEIELDVFGVDPADPVSRLRDATADVVFARLPIDAEGLHSITLYEEQPVVVLPKEHPLAEQKSVDTADLVGETRFDLDDSLEGETRVEVVASGAGVAVMPQSLARLYGRKGVTVRPVSDLPTTTIALVWRQGATTPEVDDFIGVVRGRTANSSRARADDEPTAKLGPVAKAKAKRAAAAEKAAESGSGTPRSAGGRPRTPPRGRGSSPRRGRR